MKRGYSFQASNFRRNEETRKVHWMMNIRFYTGKDVKTKQKSH